MCQMLRTNRNLFFSNQIALSSAAQMLWAKTGFDEQIDLWSPLYVHMGDTAETIRLLWDKWLSAAERKSIIDSVGSEEAAECFIVWLGATHDIGKATPAFQYKVDRRAEAVREQGLFIPQPHIMHSFSHAFMSQIILEEWLNNRGWSHANTIVSIAGSHHGAPPNDGQIGYIRNYDANFPSEVMGGDDWQIVQHELISFAFDASKLSSVEYSIKEIALPQTTQVLLSGLVVMADWIASNTEFFPLVSKLSSEQQLHERARIAWTELALPSSWHAGSFSDDDEQLFHYRFTNLPKNAELRPAQAAAMEAARKLEGPGLVIIEAPMGNGKTEASLLCAEILSNRFDEGGMAYLLPTMATTNAMFSRVKKWLENVSTANGQVQQSMQLLHSKAALNSEFSKLKTWQTSWMGDTDGFYKSTNSSREGVIAHQWFGGRKRGLLSSFVVGTVDQLLMAALKAKHVQLRHLGLAGKVVVIDEVHAYDAYMNVYLDRVMSWLGAYGVPTVILSATLPPERRNAIIRAYRGYDGKPHTRRSRRKIDPYFVPSAPRTDFNAPSYPLITSATKNVSVEPIYRPCPLDNKGTDINIEFLSDDDDLLVGTLQDALYEGGCACVLRNTVGRAQETYELLKSNMDMNEVNIKLVHSRFIAVDRMANDTELLHLLGPDSDNRPQRLIVVGTQVIEQSLDIDFDLLITDIAPVDLLFQRMGRLHRHQRGKGQNQRPLRLRKARCIITGIEDWDAEPPVINKAITHVYQPALLWRSILALRGCAQVKSTPKVNLPRDIAVLVERVYEGELAIPKSWQVELSAAQLKMKEEREESMRRANSFLLGRPHLTGCYNLDGWLSEAISINSEQVGRAMVRDTQESLEVIAVQEQNGNLELLPWVSNAYGNHLDNRSLGARDEVPVDGVARIAANCTVCLPLELIYRLPPELTYSQRMSKVISYLEEQCPVPGWQESRWLKGQLPLIFDTHGDVKIVVDNQEYLLHYSRDLGLELLSQK